MTSARQLFETLAAVTWSRLKVAESLACPQSEETITDINLFEIALARLPGVRVYKATKQVESKKGFDWEWWIGSNGSGWWRYSVQAKRLNLSSGKYDHIRHRVGDKWQIDLLSSFAKKQGSIPLYCFYNWVPSTEAKIGWQCNFPLQEEQLGCTVVPLELVLHAHKPRAKKTFTELHKDRRALPWRCLVACPYIYEAFNSGVVSRDWHPLASSDFSPRRYEGLPDALQQYSDDNNLPANIYGNELGAYPLRVAVIEIETER